MLNFHQNGADVVMKQLNFQMILVFFVLVLVVVLVIAIFLSRVQPLAVHFL
jgi:hypothetical protein